MKKTIPALVALLPLLAGVLHAEPLSVSGVYPSLTHYNSDNECGPGALVPWAGKLWLVTYPGHKEGLSDDKLYSIDPVTLERTEFPGSVGGTHANRMIHKESQQLFIGCYAIDKDGKVRVISRDKKTGLYGRLTATARHLTDPANKVYMVNMEGAVYETDVHTLESKLLFEKPVPGHHGKGAYTAQGLLVVSNNGEINAVGDFSKKLQVPNILHDAKDPVKSENLGVLAQFDGKTWSIVERRQFTEVTGPGGIEGNANKSDPLWAVGWDKRSVMLNLLDGGKWSKFRLPKGTANYDHTGGWYTEWPRIREVGQGRMLMDMHGIFYAFPKNFSAQNPSAPTPLASHLMYTADFCDWNGRLVIGKHDTTLFENPRAGRDQSAPWFGTWDELSTFGPKQGYGSLWQGDAVKAGEASAPFLVKGFGAVTLFLSADTATAFKLRTATVEPGKGLVWKDAGTLTSGAAGVWETLAITTGGADWIALVPSGDASGVNASLQLTSAFTPAKPELFAGLAPVGEKSIAAVFRPAAAPSKALQVVFTDAQGKTRYRETNPDTLATETVATDDTATVEKLCVAKTATVWYDEASAIVKDRKGKRWRVPVANPAYAKPFSKDTPTAFREIVSERKAANIAGTFFIHGNEAGVATLQPVATHNLDIRDFCTWRGLLVLSGVKPGAKADGHVFGSGDDLLWFGKEDDLWYAGKPVGTGGPLKNTPVAAGEPSDPYLLFGYDKKTLALSHDAAAPVTFAVELDTDHAGFKTWKTFTVKPGEKFSYEFPAGFSAFWLRVKSDTECKATAQLEYR